MPWTTGQALALSSERTRRTRLSAHDRRLEGAACQGQSDGRECAATVLRGAACRGAGLCARARTCGCDERGPAVLARGVARTAVVVPTAAVVILCRVLAAHLFVVGDLGGRVGDRTLDVECRGLIICSLAGGPQGVWYRYHYKTTRLDQTRPSQRARSRTPNDCARNHSDPNKGPGVPPKGPHARTCNDTGTSPGEGPPTPLCLADPRTRHRPPARHILGTRDHREGVECGSILSPKTLMHHQ